MLSTWFNFPMTTTSNTTPERDTRINWDLPGDHLGMVEVWDVRPRGRWATELVLIDERGGYHYRTVEDRRR